MANTITHCHLSVRGALRWPKRELRGMFRSESTGKLLTADECREVLFDHLAQGHEVIPCGPACEGFDYSGNGCPGHEASPCQT